MKQTDWILRMLNRACSEGFELRVTRQALWSPTLDSSRSPVCVGYVAYLEERGAGVRASGDSPLEALECVLERWGEILELEDSDPQAMTVANWPENVR